MAYVCGQYPCPSPGCPHCDPVLTRQPPFPWNTAPPPGPTAPRLGWECPHCHKVHAPWVPACECATAQREEAP